MWKSNLRKLDLIITIYESDFDLLNKYTSRIKFYKTLYEW